MKKLVSLLLIVSPVIAWSQSVAINNDGSTADNTSILDIKSNAKGILIPRLSTAERTGIVSPAIGLTVFDSETVSYWMFRGDLNGGWAELQHNYQNLWTSNAGDIFNKNIGNVGIGTANPASKLTINGTNPVLAMMNSGLANSFIQADGVNMLISTAIDNPTGKLVLGTKSNEHMSIDHFGRVSVGTNSSFDAEFKLNANGISPRFAFMQNDVPVGFIRPYGDYLKLGSYPGMNGGLVFSPKNVDRVWINEDGQVGIGTATPVSELTVNGPNPVIELQQNGVNKGFMQALGNNLKVGTNSTNLTGNLIFQTKLLDRMMIDENGRVGIGTNTPSSVLTVNGTDPIFQLRHDGVDKGFVQLVGSDIKIGTNAANTYGRTFIRGGGEDRVTVSYSGTVGIGTEWPYQTLSLNSAEPSLGFNISDALYGSIKVDDATKNFIIEKSSLGNGKLIIKSSGGVNGWGIHLSEESHFHWGNGMDPAGYTFSSMSRILAPDFVALSVANWPDYVFADTYKLRPLSEVKKFIEENKHLPGIPSAVQMEKEGIQLGDISKRLMEKVEELTLYILQQQEQIDELKKQVQAKGEK